MREEENRGRHYRATVFLSLVRMMMVYFSLEDTRISAISVKAIRSFDAITRKHTMNPSIIANRTNMCTPMPRISLRWQKKLVEMKTSPDECPNFAGTPIGERNSS